MDMPIMPTWANDYAIAHLQAKTVPMNLIWSESAQWLWGSGVCKILGAFITPITPIRQMIMTLHTYRLRQFRCT